MQLKTILAQLYAQPALSHYIDNIPKSYYKTQIHALNCMAHLVYLLYLMDKNEELAVIFPFLMQIEFNGDFNQWTIVELGLLLYVYHDDYQSYHLQIKQKIDQSIAYGETEWMKQVNLAVHQRLINGENLDIPQHSNNLSEEFNNRLLHVAKLIKIQLYNPSLWINQQSIQQAMQENISILQRIIHTLGYRQLYPFKKISFC